MSAYQGKILDFPDDDHLWLIKWIDEFRLPHLRTRSTSVGVVLQQLSARDYAELASVRADDLSHILGKRNQAEAPALRTARLLVGSLPLIEIGQIYKEGTRVGQLPTVMNALALDNNDETEISIGDSSPAPPGWKADLPHKILNAFEYYGVYPRMAKSRCQVIRVQRDNVTYEFIIPRATIFKAFYAQHTEIAKAFCKGPWSERYEDVICMHDFESGLKTQVSAGGQWDIVLETLVPSTFAAPLALLHFDEYAQKCAESIYTNSLSDRAGKSDTPWYASAKIPYLPVDEPFRMRVKCLPLRGWASIKKFVVTSIVGTSWPSHLPIVAHGRRNSGDKGIVQIRVDGPAPFTVRPSDEQNETNPGTSIDAGEDGSQQSDIRHLPTDDWIWLNEPTMIKLVKLSSKIYEGGRPAKQTNGGDQVSTGEHTHQQGGLVRGEASVLVRAPQMRFEHIIKVMTQLRGEGRIDDIRVVPVANAWQHGSRGGRDCWSFIAEDTAKLGTRPGRSWRILEYALEASQISIHRCALVLELTIGGNSHYWIEIECRKKEQGFRSAFLSQLGEDYPDALETAIETIAQAKGINLEKELKEAFKEKSIFVDSYKHHYKSQTQSELDINSVRRFLLGR